MDVTLHLSEDYAVRNEITTQLYGIAKHWLTLAISRAPIEVQSTLQVSFFLRDYSVMELMLDVPQRIKRCSSHRQRRNGRGPGSTLL